MRACGATRQSSDSDVEFDATPEASPARESERFMTTGFRESLAISMRVDEARGRRAIGPPRSSRSFCVCGDKFVKISTSQKFSITALALAAKRSSMRSPLKLSLCVLNTPSSYSRARRDWSGSRQVNDDDTVRKSERNWNPMSFVSKPGLVSS